MPPKRAANAKAAKAKTPSRPRAKASAGTDESLPLATLKATEDKKRELSRQSSLASTASSSRRVRRREKGFPKNKSLHIKVMGAMQGCYLDIVFYFDVFYFAKTYCLVLTFERLALKWSIVYYSNRIVCFPLHPI